MSPKNLRNKMETKIYSVHDIKANTYGMPLNFANNVEAIRSFEQAVKDPNTTIAKYPSDYNLVEIGAYDSYTGSLTILENKQILVNASSFLQ